MDSLPIENGKKLKAYARHWNIVGAAALTWQILPDQYRLRKDADKTDRLSIAEHLLEQISPRLECTRFAPLRDALRQHCMTRDAFYELVAREDLRSRNGVMKEAAIYIALYYWRVTGTFEIANFAKHYRDANNF